VSCGSASLISRWWASWRRDCANCARRASGASCSICAAHVHRLKRAERGGAHKRGGGSGRQLVRSDCGPGGRSARVRGGRAARSATVPGVMNGAARPCRDASTTWREPEHAQANRRGRERLGGCQRPEARSVWGGSAQSAADERRLPGSRAHRCWCRCCGAATADAVPVARAATVEFAHAAGAAADTVSAIGLAVTEACSNAVVHACVDAPTPGWVDVCAGARGRADRDRRRRGTWDDTRTDIPRLGIGLPLIAQLADRVEILDTLGRPGVALLMQFRLDD
jgi:anti-sigma regulatory factor (Ser/Thr protein kinase)